MRRIKDYNYPLAKRHLSKCLIVCLLVCLSACEKEIDIDYHQVEPIYVVEASVSNSGMAARISQTNAMDDNTSKSDISQAIVTVTGNDGTNEKLNYSRNGYYRASKKGTPGVEYKIDVELDGHHFTSTSIMQQQPKMNEFRFIRKKIMTEWFQMGDLRIQDLPNEDNWYFMHIYRNDLGYRWAVLSDRNNPSKELQQLFSFFREGDDNNDTLHEGDRLHIEIRAIDLRSYEYLYSMQVMESSGTNPIANFTGGCLGYFSAFGQITYDCIYHAADVVTEED